jgi:hypothetical protein
MKTTTLPSLAAFSLGLLLAACTHGPYTPKPGPLNPETQGAPLVLLDKDLRRTLSADGPIQASRTSAGQLQAEASLRNRTNDETLSIAVQTVFRDAQGRALDAAPPWKNYTLSPNQSIIHQATSVSPAAESFTLRVRYLKQPHLH